MEIARNVVFKWLCWNNSKKAENNSAALSNCLLKKLSLNFQRGKFKQCLHLPLLTCHNSPEKHNKLTRICDHMGSHIKRYKYTVCFNVTQVDIIIVSKLFKTVGLLLTGQNIARLSFLNQINTEYQTELFLTVKWKRTQLLKYCCYSAL